MKVAFILKAKCIISYREEHSYIQTRTAYEEIEIRFEEQVTPVSGN